MQQIMQQYMVSLFMWQNSTLHLTTLITLISKKPNPFFWAFDVHIC